MSTEHADLIDGAHQSECCGAPALGEVCNGLGLCSRCREHATFEKVNKMKPGMTWYWYRLGGHTHIRVFMNGGKAGDLCLRNEEFDLVREQCPAIDFIEEEPK